jgi:hypothetical protein
MGESNLEEEKIRVYAKTFFPVQLSSPWGMQPTSRDLNYFEKYDI